METAVKKSNKENSKPEAGLKKAKSMTVMSKPVPLHLKNLREEPKLKSFIKTNDPDVKKQKTLSQVFLTAQSSRHHKLVAEVQKPPTSVPPKPAPGTYKGRVIKSKIDCFRKPGDESAIKLKPEAGKGSNIRSNSVTTLHGFSRARVPPGLNGRTKSVSDAQLNVTSTHTGVPSKQKTAPPKQTAGPIKAATGSLKPAAGPSKQATIPKKPTTVQRKPVIVCCKEAPVSSKPPVMPPRTTSVTTKPTSLIKKKETSTQIIISKPAEATMVQKHFKPISSSISQYRVRVESAEERRAKLADWLASKGKTLKRPVIMEKPTAPTRTSAAPPKPVNLAETKQILSQASPVKPAFSSSPSHIMNTTLDLLENSDIDLPVDPEIRIESLVMNLCNRLDEMDMDSSMSKHCGSDEAEIIINLKVEEENSKESGILKELDLNINQEEMDSVQKQMEEKKTDENVKIKQQIKEEEQLKDEEDEEMKVSGSADVTDACVVKYSIKTTPFLQSVRKRIDDELAPATPGSRCKSGINELKFLTPVRRSSRIQRNSCRLPEMLNDHDPCVSSLAELELLDAADSNAYIYRKNPALLLHLSEQKD